MSVNLIFKIAAGWDFSERAESGVKTQWTGRTCFFDQSGRTYHRAVLDRALYL